MIGAPVNIALLRNRLVVIVVLLCTTSCNFIVPKSSLPAEGVAPLIYQSSLTYIGAFRVPQISSSTGGTFAWAASGLAYNAANNSLFMTGHDHHQFVGEFTVPTSVLTTTISELPIATLLQAPVDITEGNLSAIGVNGVVGEVPVNAKIGGLLVESGRLLGTIYAYYESAGSATRSHFSSGLLLSTRGDFSGVYTVGTLNSGFVAGYMASIPTTMQSKLGGTMLTGQACIPIISRSSYGPSISAMNPVDLSKTVAATTVPLLYYPGDHPALGEYYNESMVHPIYNMTTSVRGVVAVEGFNSVLFVGSTGMGIPEYGAGTDSFALDGKKLPNYDEYYVYDPASPLTKGPHAWPYVYYMWAYNVDDLEAVALGNKKPWEILPYSHWSIQLPFIVDSLNSCDIGGVAYDPGTGRIFISQLLADNNRPIIHVFMAK